MRSWNLSAGALATALTTAIGATIGLSAFVLIPVGSAHAQSSEDIPRMPDLPDNIGHRGPYRWISSPGAFLSDGGSRYRPIGSGYEAPEPENNEQVPNEPCAGNPIGVSSGTKIQVDTDFMGEGEMALGVNRRYSSGFPDTSIGLFGKRWASNLEHVIERGDACRPTMAQGQLCPTAATAETITVVTDRGERFEYKKLPNATNGRYTRPRDPFTYVQPDTAGGATLWRTDGSYIKFNPDGRVAEFANTYGWRWTYTYKNDRITIKDDASRSITLTLDPATNLVRTMTDPDGKSYGYAYDTARNLKTVTYPGGATDQRTYHYDTPTLGYLSGIDIGGVRFATFNYYLDDPQSPYYGRGKESFHADGAEKVTFVYGNEVMGGESVDYTDVTNALRGTTRYQFAYRNNRKRQISMDRSATAACPNGKAHYTYDANGFPATEVDFEGNTTRFTYNSDGQMVGLVEGITPQLLQGLRYTDLARDAKNRVTSTVAGQIDVAANHLRRPVMTTTYVYGASTTASTSRAGDVLNRIKSITARSHVGRTVTETTAYSYNTFGGNNSAKIKEEIADGPASGAGDTVTTVFDAAQNVTSMSNSLGHRTAYSTYNQKGQVGSIASPNGDSIALSYDDRGRVMSQTKTYGGAPQTTTFGYDRFGQLRSVIEPGRPEVTLRRDDAGRLVDVEQKTVDATPVGAHHGTGRRYRYDINSNVTEVAEYGYQHQPDIIQCTTQPDGTQLCYSVPGTGGTCAFTQKAQYREYDQHNRLATLTDGEHAGVAPAFSCSSPPVQPREPRTQFTYDKNGNLATATDPLGHTTSYRYDSLSRQVSATDAKGFTTTTRYGFFADLLALQVVVTPPQSPATTHRYDGFGLPLSVISPDSGQTDYTYSNSSRLASVQRADGTMLSYAYDTIGRVLTVTKGDVPAVATATLASRTQRSNAANGLGAAVRRAFAPAPATTQAAGDKVIDSYTYDCTVSGERAVGRLCEAVHAIDYGQTDAYWTTRYAYTDYGALKSHGESQGALAMGVGYRYDAFGRRAGEDYANGISLNYRYTPDGLSEIDAVVGGQTLPVARDIRFDASGNVQGFRHGNGLSRTVGRRPDGHVSEIRTFGTSTLQQLTIDYDAAQRLTSIQNGAVSSADQTYGYDAVSQLTSSVLPGVSETWTHTAIGHRQTHQRGPVFGMLNYSGNKLSSINAASARTYLHDLLGNREAQIDGGVTSRFYYDPSQTQRFLFRPFDAGIVCDPTDPSRCSPLGRGIWEYGSNHRGQRMFKAQHLVSAVTSVCENAPMDPGCLPSDVHPERLGQYLYDGAGRLLGENSRPAYQTPDGFWGYGEVDTSSTYVWLGYEPIAMIRDGALYAVAADHLGRPEVVADAAQRTIWRASNRAFDRDVKLSNPVFGELNLGFPGQYRDSESGLWYNWHRYYDPIAGRYTQADPIGLAGGINTFSYAAGNPVGLVDPFGLWCLTDAEIDIAASTAAGSVGVGIASRHWGGLVVGASGGLIFSAMKNGPFSNPAASPLLRDSFIPAAQGFVEDMLDGNSGLGGAAGSFIGSALEQGLGMSPAASASVGGAIAGAIATGSSAGMVTGSVAAGSTSLSYSAVKKWLKDGNDPGCGCDP